MLIQLKVGESRRLIQIDSEPYVVYGRLGYQPAIGVTDVHTGDVGYLIISAVSLGEPLRELQIKNNESLKGLTISIQKENSSRMSKYIVALAD